MYNEEKLLTDKELAEATGYTLSYIRKLKTNGEIPYYQNKKGEPIRYSRTEFLNTLHKNTNDKNKKSELPDQ